jgi:hypothetical protein
VPPYFETLSERTLTGLALGTFLGLWFAVAYLVNPHAALAHYGFTAWRGLAMGVVGGGGAGLIAGLLAPLTRYLVGATLVGALALLPFAVQYARARTGHLDWVLVALIAIPLGGGLGAVYFMASRVPARSDST